MSENKIKKFKKEFEIAQIFFFVSTLLKTYALGRITTTQGFSPLTIFTVIAWAFSLGALMTVWYAKKAMLKDYAKKRKTGLEERMKAYKEL